MSTENNTKTEEPVVEQVAEPTTETTTPEATKDKEEAAKSEEPIKPTPSRSGTKRLSLFLNKAMKSLVPEETKALPKDPQPEEEETPAEPASTSEPTEPTTSDDKQEKRKSKFLNGLFKKVTKEDKPVADESAKEETTAPEQEETPQEQEPVAEPSAPAVPPKDTEPKTKETNVVDQIKRHSLVNKWFGKKPAADPPAEQPTQPTEDAPVATNDVAEPSSEEAHENPARTASPLGRRLTQILRGFPKNKKKAAEKEDHHDEPAEAPAVTPTVQATA